MRMTCCQSWVWTFCAVCQHRVLNDLFSWSLCRSADHYVGCCRDGIGAYERWRANLLASMGYAGETLHETRDTRRRRNQRKLADMCSKSHNLESIQACMTRCIVKGQNCCCIDVCRSCPFSHKWLAEHSCSDEFLKAKDFCAAMVADIYTTSVQQGPDLPMANRSQLTTLYSSNQTLYVARINGALDTVSHPWNSTGH